MDIKTAEENIERAHQDLVAAIKATYPKGSKVFIKGPKGEKEVSVINTDGEDLILTTAKGEMKRNYKVVRKA